MAELWSLRGLSWRELVKRTCRSSWEDEVFGQAARLAFYYFLGIFPGLLLLLLLLDTFASTGSELRKTLLDSFQQIVPREASALITKIIGELNAIAVSGSGALWAALGAAWATLNGTCAMIVGLNRAYEVKEERRWWRILTIAFGLTISLGVMGLMALGGTESDANAS
jgi:membrane protein